MSTPAARVFGKGTNRKRDVPIFICCYHKVGTVLLGKVVQSLCLDFGWSFRLVAGRIDTPPTDADVVVFLHSLVNLDSVGIPYTGAHFIRDPRDVIVSGYLYHLRCDEKWCTNKNLEPISPIRFPQVPYSQEQRSEEWKKQYLRSLRGRSYQETLRSLDECDGLLFEMCNYGRWTIESMLNWNYSLPNMLEVRFETVMSEFDVTFKKLFESFGLAGRELSKALRIVAKEDLGRMTDEQLAAMDHVSSGGTTKWQKYFGEVHKEAFKHRFGDALVRLGYEASNDW
jgi:hypothetical protein